MPRAVVRQIVVAAASSLVLGCAAHRAALPASQPTTSASTASTAPSTTVATGPVVIIPTPLNRQSNVRAEMPLEQVPPRPKLPTPSTQAGTTTPPVEAVQDFAQARVAMLDNERYTAINLLEKAVTLDPGSFELNNTLGKLYQGNMTSDDRSIDAFERAATIDPDHLDLQINLGRQYLASGKTSLGIRHLLLGLQTTDYSHDGAAAAELELFLSNALAQQGYDRAAITLLERLSIRLRNAGMGMRSRPTMLLLLEHPEGITLQIGTLEQARGRYDEAMAAYDSVARQDPDNVEVQGRIIQTLAAMGRHRQAVDHAGALVVKLGAREPSISLLKDAFRGDGGDEAAGEKLGELYSQHPKVRQLLFARLDLLHSMGRGAEAEKALADAAALHPDDPELWSRQFQSLYARGDRPGAAELLIRGTAQHPEWTAEAGSLFAELVRPTTHGRLQLADLRNLKLQSSEEPARLYWIARWAMTWHRDGIARHALDQAVATEPVFAPAYRDQIELILTDPAIGATTRPSADALAAGVAKTNPTLGAELRGLVLLRLNQPKEAVQELAQALKGSNDAEVAIEFADANSANGDDAAFESAMWKLLSDHPNFDQGYQSLHDYYMARSSEAMQDRVLATWLAARPDSPGALRLQAAEYYRANRTDAAESILLRLLNGGADNPEVLGALTWLYQNAGKPEGFPQKMEEELAHDPGNFAAVSALTQLYIEAHRPAEAARVLNASRKFEANDPDLLYTLSSIYMENDDKPTAEDVLRDALKADPTHAGAANDLGYFLAESGQNLTEAEALTRRAVNAEPFNASFLDSLGWVLYKQSRFSEAQKLLEQATSGEGDPLVLNHLGDTLYRLGSSGDAAKTWKRAADRLLVSDQSRQDLRGLQQQLQQKQIELNAGQPVEVAPVVPPATTQPDAIKGATPPAKG
jgi:predicted Zn-dependent protease